MFENDNPSHLSILGEKMISYRYRFYVQNVDPGDDDFLLVSHFQHALVRADIFYSYFENWRDLDWILSDTLMPDEKAVVIANDAIIKEFADWVGFCRLSPSIFLTWEGFQPHTPCDNTYQLLQAWENAYNVNS